MMNNKRTSGILMHVTSLPSPFGIGDLGPGAYRFIDWMQKAGQHLWQILPLTPTEMAWGNSPYSSPSAFAINPLIISPERLVDEGLLTRRDLAACRLPEKSRIDFARAVKVKRALLERAFQNRSRSVSFDRYRRKQRAWLEDYALFMALREFHQGRSWVDWPKPLRDREPKALTEARREFRDVIDFHAFCQFLVERQWTDLRRACAKRGIQIVGDLPIYVNHDSSDVWCHRDLFQLRKDGWPRAVSGVPPDYFSKTGQLWGNPLYRWDVMRARNYRWWMQRIERNAACCDVLRIDHFRGFVGYWSVPATHKTALRGRWVKAPALDFFTRVQKRFPKLNLIAEDLGVITDDVRDAMERLHLPGMRPILFGFGGDARTNPYAPHAFSPRTVAYAGTHDTNTVRGWFDREAKAAERGRLDRYCGRAVTSRDVSWTLIHLGMQSVAERVIVPMQDVLSLGASDRMNLPGSAKGNWAWRVRSGLMTASLARRLRRLSAATGRVD